MRLIKSVILRVIVYVLSCTFIIELDKNVILTIEKTTLECCTYESYP